MNKTALVTGAGSGIGAGIAARLADRGASVALVDVDAATVTDRAQSLAAAGHRASAHVGDVLDKKFVAETVDAVVAEWGTIDILVNNAGILRDNLIENISEADWDAVLGVNLKGAFLCARAAVPHMKKQRHGKIVNIISRSWLGNRGQSNYAASKGGLVSLTRTLALELARDGINVNGVAPGMIDTPMTQRLPDWVKEGRRIGKVEDIASAVCFLVSDDSRFITGQVLHVDGGDSCGVGSP